MATPRPIEPMERTPTVAKGADMINGRRNVAAVVEGELLVGLTARRGHGKTRQGQKVQPGQNFKFYFVTLLSF